jgi:hypothetical protein
MDEEMRVMDLVNNPTPAMVAAYFHRMYPDDYTWRRYGSMFTRGWSGIDTWGRESSSDRERREKRAEETKCSGGITGPKRPPCFRACPRR